MLQLLSFRKRTKIIEKEGVRGIFHNGKEYYVHTDLPFSESALFRLSLGQKLVFVLITALLLCSYFFDWRLSLLLTIAILTSIYFGDLIFNMYLIFRSFAKPPEITISENEIALYPDTFFPMYTILCPLYKEDKVLPQFIKGLSQLSYPKDKLQVLLLLEADDSKTIHAAQYYFLPSYVEKVIIPHSNPKTKPKALNYGLKHAKGEYIVIYDAEDIPEKFQLKKAVIAFHKADPTIKCIQAKLNFYNPHQNLLTRIFTAEYSLWFDLVLTGLQSIHAPIPLGGTSNHFRKSDIERFSGWDAFNVTEDADLGIRISKRGFKTAIVNSTTYEEANSSISNWFWQRTRWIKGYMQTYLVHMRKPLELVKRQKSIHVFTFQMVIGGKVAAMLINPIMWILTIVYFTQKGSVGMVIEEFFPPPILYMGVVALIVGNFLYMYYYMIGCAKRGKYSIMKYVFLVPFYWLAISVASYFALYKLVVNPHYWSKTKHGLHIKDPSVTSSYQLGFK